MSKVIFSSWNGKIVDERKKENDDRINLNDLNIPIQYDQKDIKAMIGWAGLVIVDPDLNIVSSLNEYYKNVQKESCGRCVPCRAGSKIIADCLKNLLNGNGCKKDLSFLREVACLIRNGSLCELGISSPVPLLDALDYFNEDFEALINGKEGKPKDGNYSYHPILTAPCRNGCPAHINIPAYIECIKEGDYEGALAVNREKTPLVGTLGRVCVHPCESNCNRQPYDQSLSIRLLKRYAADFGARNDYDRKIKIKKAPPTGDKVAIIGAGPAGLNAAYKLAQKGYGVTIYEALPVAGGMLAVGIPSYRLPRDILNAEVDLVKSLGVEFIYNTKVGEDITIDQIWEKGFKAIFIASGLHDSATMGCEGEDQCYMGYMPGVEYLRKINLGETVKLGNSVAIIGGGNVAMDCARSAVRLGVKDVHLIYRRSKNEMPANKAEIDAAEEEGVQFHLLANPTCILEDSGAVSGMECVKMELGEPDESGRRRPIPVDGSEFILSADTVIPAIGQVADFCFLNDDCGMDVTKWGTLVVDEETMASESPGIFAGGDAVLGASTVIEAIASANRAAEAIDKYLREGKIYVSKNTRLEKHIEKAGVYEEKIVPEMIGERRRQEEEVMPVKQRMSDFSEAELGFRYPSVAVEEARRCVKCLRLGMIVVEAGRESNE
ncbi:MAG: FAD-dependent oxidoreductase [Bacillota bacterium]